MPSLRWLLPAFAVVVVAGIFAGRAIWPPPAPVAAPASAAAMPASVPAFSLKELSTGETRAIGDWTSRALILNFWATWCAPCRKEMPLLEQLHQERGERDPMVVGIAIDHEEPVRRFVAETGVTYPILVGQEDAMAAAESFGPAFVGLPLTVVTAPGGAILAIHMGELHPENLAAIVAVIDGLAAGRLTLAEARAALKTG